MSVPRLAVVESDGGRTIRDYNTGAVFQQPPSYCPACESQILAGQRVTHTGSQWAHEKCVTDWLVTEKADVAWRVLGSQLARRPRQFSAKDTTTIVDQLLRLSGGLPPAPWQSDHESYQGED